MCGDDEIPIYSRRTKNTDSYDFVSIPVQLHKAAKDLYYFTSIHHSFSLMNSARRKS
jgi:hypothetical protein